MKIRELLKLNRGEHFYTAGPIAIDRIGKKPKKIGEHWGISNELLDTEVEIICTTKARVDDRNRPTHTG